MTRIRENFLHIRNSYYESGIFEIIPILYSYAILLYFKSYVILRLDCSIYELRGSIA